MAVGILGSKTCNPCSRRRSPHHHRISRCAVDLVEGAARQSGVECVARNAGERVGQSGRTVARV
jgi:hypothetical protein